MANNIVSRITGLFQNTLPRPKPFSDQGVPGIVVHGGYIATQERNQKLIGAEKYRTFSDILANTSIVAAGVRYFLNLVAKPSWSCEPADDSVLAGRYAEFAEAVLFNDLETPWSRVIRRAGTYRFYGFSVQEWTAMRREDKLIGLRDVQPRPQRTVKRWEIDPNGKVIGLYQTHPQTGQEVGLPRDKFIYLVDDTLSDDPEGMGLLRHLAEPSERLAEYLDQEGTGFLRDLRGIAVGRVPLQELNQAIANGDITEAQMNQAISDLTNFVKMEKKGKDTGLILSSQTYINQTDSGDVATGSPKWDVDLITGTAPGLADVGAAINRINHEMARILGVEQLLLGSDGTGSLALSQEKASQLYLTVNSMLRDIRLQMERDLLWKVWALNGFPWEMMPSLNNEDVAFRDVTQITAALKDMAVAGAPLAPDDEVQNFVRDMLGAPRVDLNRLALDRLPDLMLGAEEDEGVEEDEIPEEGEEEKELEEVVKRINKKLRKISKQKNRRFKFDEDQPRADDGKWTDGGGGSSGSGSASGAALPAAIPNYSPRPSRDASELFSRNYDSSVTEEQVINSVPGYREKMAEAEKARARDGSQSTQDKYMKDGTYTVERADLHREIIRDIFKPEQVSKALPKPGERPKLVLLGGRAGAGKSWFTSSEDSPFDASKFVVLNSDDVKGALPEYKGYNADILHEESKDITGRADYIARSIGVNVVHDATMRSPDTMARLVKEYKAAGYDVEGYFMHTAPQVSAVRAAERAVKTGRLVPVGYTLSSTSNEKSFDSLKDQMSKWAVYDNNGDSGPVLAAKGSK